MTARTAPRRITMTKDRLWLGLWIAGLALLGVWDALFLNAPAFALLRTAFLNTVFAGSMVVVFSLILGWLSGITLHFAESRNRGLFLPLTFLLNLIRSVPQIVGILVGYVVLTIFIERDLLRTETAQLLWMAVAVSIVVFLEVTDVIRERITYFSKLDFVQAMLCCGIRESRIINREILWKNSRAHFLQKMVSIFGTALFLQCSIDFIISVGLSTDVSLSNFPVTLGSLLAKLDSKQDILAIGGLIAHPGSVSSLLFVHLQGVSVAFVIVFTLVCVYKISNGMVERFRL
jgi:ABC-type dipeptide/oligopeptide/nickel transport system permease subunit